MFPAIAAPGCPPLPRMSMFQEEANMVPPESGYGYYPVNLQDTLQDGQLRIVRKLGYGRHSTVWLARSQEVNNSYPTRYVAVKILTVAATRERYTEEGVSDEIKVLRTIKTANPFHPGFKHCLQLYDNFFVKSHYGSHFCIVTNVLVRRIGSLDLWDPANREGGRMKRGLPPPVCKQIIEQILLALHQECGVTNANLMFENIFLSLDWTDEEIDKFLEANPPLKYRPNHTDCYTEPVVTIKSQPFEHSVAKGKQKKLNICLIGFSLANIVNYLPMDDFDSCAPEILLGHLVSPAADIWTVGCFAFRCLRGVLLFDIYGDSDSDSDEEYLACDELIDDILIRIITYIGPFPHDFLMACKKRKSFFNDEGNLLCTRHRFKATSLQKRLEEVESLTPSTIKKAMSFIRKCLVIDPAKRATASELLTAEWLKDRH